MNVKILVGMFVAFQAVILIGQITTLVSTYWTSWELKFNWTKTIGEFSRRPTTEGQLVSQGHAGLWSRCFRAFRLSADSNSTPAAFTCLHNYEGEKDSERYTFGKACKIATAGLCVGEAAVTFVLMVVVSVTTCCPRGLRILKQVPLPLVLAQGIISFVIPLIYLSGNMAELIAHLSATYDLLLIVHMEPWYAHDWAFWTQVGLSFLWIVTTGLYVVLYSAWYKVQAMVPPNTNGKKTEHAEIAELQSLRSDK